MIRTPARLRHWRPTPPIPVRETSRKKNTWFPFSSTCRKRRRALLSFWPSFRWMIKNTCSRWGRKGLDCRSRPFNHSLKIQSVGQAAEGPSRIVEEAGGQEGLGDGGMAEADQEGGLKGDGHLLHHAPGLGLLKGAAGDFSFEGLKIGVQAGILSLRQADLLGEGLQGLGLLAHGAEYIQADHVARTFPNGVQGGLAVNAGQDRLLHEAVASQ